MAYLRAVLPDFFHIYPEKLGVYKNVVDKIENKTWRNHQNLQVMMDIFLVHFFKIG